MIWNKAKYSGHIKLLVKHNMYCNNAWQFKTRNYFSMIFLIQIFIKGLVWDWKFGYAIDTSAFYLTIHLQRWTKPSKIRSSKEQRNAEDVSSYMMCDHALEVDFINILTRFFVRTDDNFTNISWVAFWYESVFQSFSLLTAWLCIFW